MSTEKQPTNIKVVQALVLQRIFFLGNLTFLLANTAGERSFPLRFLEVYIIFCTPVCVKKNSLPIYKSFRPSFFNEFFFLANLTFLLANKAGERSFPLRFLEVYIFFCTPVCVKRNSLSIWKSFGPSFSNKFFLLANLTFLLAIIAGERSFPLRFVEVYIFFC